MNIPPAMVKDLAGQHQTDLLAAAEQYRRRRRGRRDGTGAAPRPARAIAGAAPIGAQRLYRTVQPAGPVDLTAWGRRHHHPACGSDHPGAFMIDVRGLRKAYGERTVVDGIDLTVQEGEIFGILGPNGAGKTTTVECIGGLRRPDGGSIRVAGLDPSEEGTAFREVLGIQLQESRLPDKQTVAEALQLYASFYARPRDWRELAERLGLADQHGTYFGKLSGGQKQRLSVALALIGNPRVAILDELTTGLDPAARREVWGLLEDLKDTGVTLLLVSHFMEEAERLCDRVVVIDHGRVIAADTPEGLAAAVVADQEMSFVPSASFDPATLRGLPDVHAVTATGTRVAVTGTDNVAAAVITTLHEMGIAATKLRVGQPSLDDAFVALTRADRADRADRDASGEGEATVRLPEGARA